MGKRASEPISSADMEATAAVVAHISKWGMTGPALLALSIGKPLGFFGAQLLYFGQPILQLLDGVIGKNLAPRAHTLAQLLENPAAVEHLTAALDVAATAPPPPSQPEGEHE